MKYIKNIYKTCIKKANFIKFHKISRIRIKIRTIRLIERIKIIISLRITLNIHIQDKFINI